MDMHASASGRSTVYQAGNDLTIIQPPPPPSKAWKVPPRNPNFTGRAEDLARLAALLDQATVTVQALRGMGGVGKTQLAIEHCHRHAEHYDIVWWISAENPALIPDQFHLLGKALGLDLPEQDAAPLVLSHLRGRDRWLLVFDNAESVHDLREHVPAGRALVTTRRAGFDALGGVLDLDTFSRAESVALLVRRTGISDEHADTLADLLGDLPLGLEQAAAYLNQTRLPVTEYLDLLRRDPEKMAGRGQDGHRPSPESSLATLWTLSLTRLDAEASAVIEVCAYLAPEPIPLDLFEDVGHEVGSLVDYSLAERDDDHLVLHRLVQLAVRGHGGTAGHWPHPLIEAALRLRAILPMAVHVSPESWPRWRQLLPHVLAVLDYDRTLGLLHRPDVVHLAEQAGIYLQTMGRSESALLLFERALYVLESVVGPEHELLAVRLNHVAFALRELGRFEEALPLLERALAIAEVTDDPLISTLLDNLAVVVGDLGDPRRAGELLERAIALDEATFGPDHVQVAIGLGNLAQVRSDLGDLAGALGLVDRAFAMAETFYGPDHPDLATFLRNLAAVLRKRGELVKARVLFERALVLSEAGYGPEYHTTMESRTDLVSLLTHLGLEAEAERASGYPRS